MNQSCCLIVLVDFLVLYVFEHKLDCDVLIIALPDDYVEHGNVELLKQEVGIDTETMVKRIITQYISWGNKHRKDTVTHDHTAPREFTVPKNLQEEDI